MNKNQFIDLLFEKIEPYINRFSGFTDKAILWKNRMLRKKAHSRRNLDRFTPAEKQLKKIKLIRLGAMLVLGSIILGIVGFFGVFAWYSRDLPKPGQVVRRDGFSTKVYDRNGELLYDLFSDERRNPIKIEQVPESLKHATVAIEDKDFYKHSGFDLMTIVRIPYNMLFKQRVVGGSTLTQQLVKNVLLTNERTISRKFKELVLSIQIERTFSKDQILEMYLNEAPYGGTAWGVGTAAEVYFNKSISDLTLAESALLAGLPQRPSVYSPHIGKSDENGEPYWRIRTTSVLNGMKRDGYITDIAYEEALGDLQNMTFEKTTFDIKAPHFVFYVRDLLEEMYGADLVEKGGLKVTTSLDWELQKTAQEIVAEEIQKVEDLNITNGAAMIVNPQNGEIISMVGSRDYFHENIDGQFNVAADGLRQPGSSIKPVTYLAMMQKGYSPASMIVDVPTTFAPNDSANKYEPKNYDGTFRGPVNLRNSLGSSLNIPAVKSLAIVGVDNFLQLAYDMGFYTLEPTTANMKRFGLAVTLGGAEVHLIDTVSAYSSFANGGRKVEPVAILKVEDKDGRVIFDHKHVEGPRVFSEEEAFLINNILSDNNARLMAFGANSLLNTGKPIAVKTGTTNDQRDNWTVGWSKEVMVGVWVGNNDNSAMKSVASGISGASPIWRRIILSALENGYGAPEWDRPSGIEEVMVDKISGYPQHDEFESRMDFFIKGTVPALPDPIHSKLKLCKGENKLATEAKISANDFEEKIFITLREEDPFSEDGKNRWQEGINAWIAGQEGDLYKPPTEYCGDSSDVSVKLSRPENEKKYDDEDIEVRVEAGSDEGIDKIEIWVNGSKKETVNDRSYKGKINLPAGQHEIYAKAFSRGGKEAKSKTVKIGTGGQDWKAPEPTATPAPTAVPTSAPTPLPTTPVVPTAIPTLAL
jgi:1A family penicillin-binding protein